jgi:hypothetical protein
MSLDVAVDNSVLADLVANNVPKNKQGDRIAFEKMIDLAKQSMLKIGIPISTTMIEEAGAGAKKRNLLRKKMGQAYRLWPVVVSKKMHDDIEKKKECLKEIMQDKGGVDSENLLVSTIHTPYYITTDYRYHRQFNAQFKRIREKCGISVFVLTPSEFMTKYEAGKI